VGVSLQRNTAMATQKPIWSDAQVTAKHLAPVAGTYTLFIGNLPFDVTGKDVRRLFEKHGTVKSVRVPMNKTVGCSRGFAFVTMESTKAKCNRQEDLITKMNGCLFYGRILRVSEAVPPSRSKDIPRQKLAKLYISNLSRKVWRNDLVALYRNLGIQIKDVVLPTEDNSSINRGFAFVIIDEEHAEMAIEATNGIMLHGLPLEASKARKSNRIKLYLGGLSPFTTVEQIEKTFQKYGSNVVCQNPGNHIGDTGKALCRRGYAFVTLDTKITFHAAGQLNGDLTMGDQTIQVRKYSPASDLRTSLSSSSLVSSRNWKPSGPDHDTETPKDAAGLTECESELTALSHSFENLMSFIQISSCFV